MKKKKEYNGFMELKGIIVNGDVAKKDQNLYRFIENIREDFLIVTIINKQPVQGELELFLSQWGLSKEDVLLLCHSNEWVVFGKKHGLATLAYAPLEGGVLFPDAEFVVEGIEQLTKRDLVRRFQREKGLPWIISTTERLIIREEVPEDAEHLYEIYESPSIKRFLEPLYADIEQERQYLKDYYKYIYTFFEYGLWHLELKKTHVSIGRAGLTPKSYEDGVQGAELGYVIDEKFQGQGYCMEACTEILRYAREELELKEIYCLIRPDNRHSIRICLKLGFSFEKEMVSEGRDMNRYLLKFE